MKSTPLRITMVLGLAMAAFVVGISGASSAPSNKNWSLAASSTVPTGANQTVTITVTNTSTTVQLGALSVSTPSWLTVNSANFPCTYPTNQGCPSSASAGSIVGPHYVEIHNVAIPKATILKKSTYTFTLNVSTPLCGANAYDWAPTATAKQANDYSGNGNDFGVLTAGAGSTTTFVRPSAAASLSWVTQPPAENITGQSISPAPAVKVSTVCGDPSNASVTVALDGSATNVSNPTLNGTKTRTASNGVATFSGLSVTPDGNGYKLVASSPGASSASSNAFNVSDSGIPCSVNKDCSGTATGTNTTGYARWNANGNSGTAYFSYTSFSYQCAGDDTFSTDAYSFHDVGLNRRVDFGYTVNGTWPFTELQSLSQQMQACYASTIPWAGGVPTVIAGVVYYVGLLPNCPDPANVVSPCVTSRSYQVTNLLTFTGKITINAAKPGGGEDPLIR